MRNIWGVKHIESECQNYAVVWSNNRFEKKKKKELNISAFQKSKESSDNVDHNIPLQYIYGKMGVHNL